MTFNVRRAGDEGPDAWRNRLDPVAEMVLREAPDVLFTQEATLPQLADLDARLHGYLRVGGERERWPGEEPNAIYYDPSRVRVADAGMFWLTPRPLRLGGRTWGCNPVRNALWAVLVYVETGAPLLVVNTHLDHNADLARRRGALLLERLAPHAVLAGDFNTWPDGFVHRLLTRTRRDPLEGARATLNAFSGEEFGRFDWIILPGPLRALRAAVLDECRPDGGGLSDHRPVVVDVEPPRVERPVPTPTRLWTREDPVRERFPPRPEEVARVAHALAQPRQAVGGITSTSGS